MKYTAVEWLVDNLISEPYSEADFKHNSDCWDKAKAMEKEQIVEEFSCGVINHYDAFKNQNEFGNGQQYYNETFKSE